MSRPRRTHQTSLELRREIERGRFKGSPTLPGERQLAVLLRVSRTTVRRALADLIEDGVVSQRHGMGTFITPATTHSVRIPVDGPLVYFGLNGRVDSVVELARTRDDPTSDEVLAFGLDMGEDVVRLTRLTHRGGAVDALEFWSAPARLVADVAEIGPDLAAAVLALGHAVVKRLRRLRVEPLQAPEATHLGADPGAIAIRLDEHHFTADARCCLINRAFYPAVRFDAVFR